MAYTSNQSGKLEVYVRSFPSAREQWQISTEGGEAPRWRGDGKELVYVTGNKIMAAPVESGSSFRVGDPKALFETPIARHPDENTLEYAVTADGQRFLAIVPEAGNAVAVVLNWTAGLKK